MNEGGLLTSTASDAVKSEPVRQLTTASAITQNLKSRLATCSSDAYLIISQPGIDAADFTSPHISPRLRRSVNLEGGVKSGFAVASVVGDLDLEELQNYLEKTCEASSLDVDASSTLELTTSLESCHSDCKLTIVSLTAGAFDVVDDMKPRVIRVDFSRPSASQPERADQLSQNGEFAWMQRCLMGIAKHLKRRIPIIHHRSPSFTQIRSHLHHYS